LASPHGHLPKYTEADLDPCAICAAQHIANFVRSLGSCVKASDIDLPGDLDCVIKLGLMEEEKAELNPSLAA